MKTKSYTTEWGTVHPNLVQDSDKVQLAVVQNKKKRGVAELSK